MKNTHHVIRALYDPASYIHRSWMVKLGLEAVQSRPAANRLLIKRLSLATAIDFELCRGPGLASVLRYWDAVPAALHLLGALALKPLLLSTGLRLDRNARRFLTIPLYFPTVLSIGLLERKRPDKALLVACGRHLIEPVSRNWPTPLLQRLTLLSPAEGSLDPPHGQESNNTAHASLDQRARGVVLAGPPTAVLISTLKMALNHASRI